MALRCFRSIILPSLLLVPAILTPVRSECCGRDNSTRTSQPKTDPTLDSLDSFHLEYVKARLLAALNIREPPREAGNWKSRFNRSLNLAQDLLDREELGGVFEENQGKEFTVRLVGNVTRGSDFSKVTHKQRHHQRLFRRSTPQPSCVLFYRFNKKFHALTPGFKPEIHSGKIAIPLSLWNDSLEMILSVPGAHHVNLFNRSFTEQKHFRIFNISREVTGKRNLHLALKLVVPRSDCPQASEQLKSSLLTLEVHEIQRKFAKRSLNNEIVDCETQWAPTMNASFAIRRDILPCCRRRIHVNFREIGWGNWVIAPESFDSYYCLGRCTTYGGFSTENSRGKTFYAELMNYRTTAKALGLSPCCSPVKFSPLTITTLHGGDEEITRTLKDVIVSKCGCM